MKMSITSYEAIESYIATMDKKTLQRVRDNISYHDSQFISFIWSVYYKLPTKIRQAVRKEDLKDDHITTALKRILNDYK